ncbi:MAG: hypothetical protein JXD23_01165 [Spirochaetales bacterium]|nr:hypothetical protein [Spirochaetales bacterium]
MYSFILAALAGIVTAWYNEERTRRTMMEDAPGPKKPPPPTSRNKKPIRVSRIFGYGFLIFGILSVIDFFSPIPIPSAGVSAIVSGLFFIALGAFLLIPDKPARFRRLADRLRRRSRPFPDIDPLIPVKILKLARERGGVLTLAETAVELSLSLPKAEAGLDECVRNGLAAADFDMEREIKYYRFHEFMPPPGRERFHPGE